MRKTERPEEPKFLRPLVFCTARQSQVAKRSPAVFQFTIDHQASM